MPFTAKDVAALREKTNVGMMECKKALTQADGDMEKATLILREKGLAAAEKKSGRIAAEGVVTAYTDVSRDIAALVEVNSETDFVAKNKDFQTFVSAVAQTVAEKNPSDVEALLEAQLSGSQATVQEKLQEKVLTIGENIQIRRFERVQGITSTYVHGGGTVGVLVQFAADKAVTGNPRFAEMGRDVAMQIAAMTPSYLDAAGVPGSVIEEEKAILKKQIEDEGKPANIAEKIVNGRIGKYYKENCLVDQVFVKNGDMNVGQYVDSVAKELAAEIKITGFTRYAKGEGLKKKEDDFASEVAGMVK